LFRADWDNLSWDKHIDDDAAAAATAHMVCPVNACIITPNYKALMNAACVWQSEAQVFGTPYTGRGATYWMQGPAAAFETWENLVYKYLIALRDFENTGNQEKLKSTVNTDQGRPYTVATAKGDGLDAVLLKQRAEGYAQQRCVPAAARFLTTAVDVQKHRFVVQVTAWGVDKERWIVDRYNLTTSDRIGEDGTRQKIAPFTHAEDWNVLDKLLDDRYAIEGSDATVQSLKVLCDSGGGKGDHGGTATANAYVYALRLRRLGRLSRFALLKGASSRSAARYAKGKADEGKIKVPLYVVNTTILKDETAAALNRQEPGPGYIHLPDWAGEWYFKELTAEVRTSSGWAKRRKADNNEEFDLMGYQSINYSLLGGDKINWETPPDWAAKPLGEVLAEADTVQASGNEAYLKALRERGQRRNG
jgi:phage terminase large subunit GpA-like protein